jgi:glutamate racemase
MQQSPNIDTILLACTHYPLLQDKIKAHLPAHINVVAQGDIVATSLVDYLAAPSRNGATHSPKPAAAIFTPLLMIPPILTTTPHYSSTTTM